MRLIVSLSAMAVLLGLAVTTPDGVAQLLVQPADAPDARTAPGPPDPPRQDAGPPIRLTRTTAAGVPVRVVTVNLEDPAVKVTGMLARGGAGRSEPWSSMIARARPTAAVTGTYFDLRSLLPIGDLVIDGRLVHFGGNGTALCLTPENEASFRRAPRYRHVDWSDYEYVVRAGPRLVTGGVVGVHPRAEGFRDPGIFRRTGRSAVGVTRQHGLVLVTTRKHITQWQMARAMKALGAWNAISLDAGTSMGLYYKGKTHVKPGRRLTNLLLVYTDPERYESVRGQLAPQRAARR